VKGRSLSVRLIVASIAAVLLAVLVFGVGARLIVSSQMHSSLDRSLRQRAIEVARLSVSAPAVLTAPGALESPLSGRQLSVEVLDRKQAIVARSLALGAKLLPRGPEVAAALGGNSGFADSELDGEPIRVFAAPIADISGPAAGGIVLVASSTADIEDTLHQLTLLLLLCGAIAVVAGGLAAAFLTRRSVRPLRQLSSSATTIERTGDASRRLAEPATPEEIGDLARALNGMLAALERSRERERRFLADASHELRTPLNAIIGFSEIMTHELFGPVGNARYIEYSRLIHESGGHLLGLINSILDMSKIEAGRFKLTPERFDFGDTVLHALRLVRFQAERNGVTLEDSIASDAHEIIADKRAVMQILINLISNGVKFTPRGGSVRVTAQLRGSTLEIAVSDTGVGIDEADVRRLGQPFEQVESEYTRAKEGTGLGLALVSALAHLHGGTMHIESVLGEGTTVRILLPSAAAIAEVKTPKIELGNAVS